MPSFSSAYTATAPFGNYTGHSASSGTGLRDGVETGGSSVWGSINSSANWVKADLGSLVSVDAVQLRCIPFAFHGWGQQFTNGSIIQTSPDDSTWTDRVTISGIVEGSESNFNINTMARYVRIFRSTGFGGLGDFKIDFTEISAYRRNHSLIGCSF